MFGKRIHAIVTTRIEFWASLKISVQKLSSSEPIENVFNSDISYCGGANQTFAIRVSPRKSGLLCGADMADQHRVSARWGEIFPSDEIVAYAGYMRFAPDELCVISEGRAKCVGRLIKIFAGTFSGLKYS